MKKNLLCSILSITLILLFFSCSGFKTYKLDGMWQLKTVEDNGGNEIKVDTVFYSFERETIFSFTTTTENSKSASHLFLGYMDMPSGDKVHVQLNDIFTGNTENINLFLSLSGWSSADITFDIKKYNSSNLVLFDNGTGKTFTLRKF